MQIFELSEEYIHLNQLLKILHWVNDGSHANAMIDDGLVKVNGQTEFRRRNKIKAGTIVEMEGNSVKVVEQMED